MAKWTGTLIGGGIGWALGGPIGALIGVYVGNMFSGETVTRTFREHPYGNQPNGSPYTQTQNTRSGDFAVAMLTLFAYVTKADNKVVSSEINYVKQFLIEKFGTSNAQDMMYIFKNLLDKEYNIYDICSQINTNMDYYSKLELVHILFGVAKADGFIHNLELKAINDIAGALRLSTGDFESISAIFIEKTNQAYAILNVKENDTDDTIKKAYRSLATKYHPDKVATLGQEIQKVAEEKFKAINEAYQKIRQERGF